MIQSLPQVAIELRTEDPLGMRIGKSAETFCGRTAKPQESKNLLAGGHGQKLSRGSALLLKWRLMMPHLHVQVAALLCFVVAADQGFCDDPFGTSLPQGVRAVWDLSKAYRETTPTRERICINGLWRWQPAGDPARLCRTSKWGYFKVPGLLARDHRLHAEGLPDALSASGLEGRRSLGASPRPGTSARSPFPATGPDAASRSTRST